MTVEAGAFVDRRMMNEQIKVIAVRKEANLHGGCETLSSKPTPVSATSTYHQK
jgi:hypothetical protein